MTQRGRVRLLARTLSLAFIIIIGWSIYHFTIVPGPPLQWDESAHAIQALVIADDLKNGDWLGLSFDTYRQVYWPPLHSWLAGPVFLLWAPSAVAIRSVSLVMFLLLGLVIYCCALQLQHSKMEVGAVISTILLMTSPPMINLAGQAMLEIPALLFLGLSLLVYTWLNNGPRSPYASMWLGLFIALTYFTKSNFGILLLIVVPLTALIDADFRISRLASKRNVYAALPIAIAFIVWFAYPPKIYSAIRAMINVPFGIMDAYSLQGFLFYPKVVMEFMGSAWISVLVLASCAAAVRYRRNPNIRMLIVLVAVQFVIGEVHRTKVARHIVPMVPPMVLLTGFVIAEWWSAGAKGQYRRVPPLATVLLCVYAVITVGRSLNPQSGRTDLEAARYLAELSADFRSSLIVGSLDVYPGPPMIDWHLIAEAGAMRAMDSGADPHLEEDEKLAKIGEHPYVPDWLKRRLPRVATRSGQGGRLRSVYAGYLPDSPYFRDEQSIAALLRRMNTTNRFDAVAVISSVRPDAKYPLRMFDPGVRALGLDHVSTRSFPKKGVHVDLYRLP